MRDWSAVVSARLSGLGLDAEREKQIRAELAGHLEDAHAEAVRRGCDEDDAVARALARVPDWVHLADAIRAADLKDGPMSHDAKILWLPGMAALGCAAALLVGTSRLLPGSVWVDPGARLPMMAAMLLSYLLCGALGAWWSRRAGGSVAARLVAGIFPLALHASIFIIVVVAGIVENSRQPEHIPINFQLRAVLPFVVIPGIALALGALPFLRDAATAGGRLGTEDQLTRG